MRNGRASGRGERARVARRVRALLADAAQTGGAGAPAASLGDSGVLPWLPGDELVSLGSAAAPSSPMPPPDAPPEPALHHRAGWLERLTTRLPVRVDPGWRGAVVIGIAVVVAAVLSGGWVLSSRPRAIAVTDTAADPGAVASARSVAASARSLSPAAPPGSATAAPSPASVMLVVDVAGKVRHPGLYRLPAGSRIDDAVQAAGGPMPGVDLTNLNLAAKLTDGQQVAVGKPGAGPGSGGSGTDTGKGSAAVTAPVDLNSATLEQLETLPGVGPVLGQHIIDWRVAHGRFTAVDQLRDVSGIGDVKFAALRTRVTV